MPTAARFGCATARHASSSGTSAARTRAGSAGGPPAARRRKDKIPIAGVSPVTLCSSSGSASSAPKAASARRTSMSGARSSAQPLARKAVPACRRRGSPDVPMRLSVSCGAARAHPVSRHSSSHRPQMHRRSRRPARRVLTADDTEARRGQAGWEVPGRRGPVRGDPMHVVARWCVTHRLVVVGLWLLVLAATFLGSSAAGSNYARAPRCPARQAPPPPACCSRRCPDSQGTPSRSCSRRRPGRWTTRPSSRRSRPCWAGCRTCPTSPA